MKRLSVVRKLNFYFVFTSIKLKKMIDFLINNIIIQRNDDYKFVKFYLKRTK